MLAVIFAVAGGSAGAVEYTHIWIDQGTGINHPDTPGTPNEPFKSITYALARADYLGWPEPWHVHIGPGVYNADPAKPAPEREIFPIELRQDMIFEAGDVNDPNTDPDDPGSRVIDGIHLVEGFASLLYGNDLTGIEIRGLTFRNMDHSTGNGGAIELVECSGLIENCIVQNCSAQSGGGLWLSPRSAPTVPFDFISCTFSNNTATDGSGGGVYITAAITGNITNCTFGDNAVTADTWGGGFGINGSLTGNINGCTFSGNSARSGGGCGGCISGNLNGNLVSCQFLNNSSIAYGGSGGGLRINDINGEIRDCLFSGNMLTATGNPSCSPGPCIVGEGGGLSATTISGGIFNSVFKDNHVDAYHDTVRGGGLKVSNLNNGIHNCSFSGNYVIHDGGGFWVYNLSGDISDCDFMQNEVLQWGSSFCIGNNITGDIKNCTFNGNVGSTGGFYITGTLTGDVRGCEFDNGKWLLGGYAVYLNGTFDGTMENCRFYDFTDNTVRLLSDSDTTAWIRSCLFVVAPEAMDDVSGWAVRTKQKTIISNNTMVGPGLDPNYSPSALYLDFDTQANNSEIFNNIVVDTEKAIVVDPAVDMPIEYNQFYDVNDIVVLGEQGLGNEIWWLEWNLSNFRNNDYGDPLFFAYDAVYHIQETSPCVDAGDPNYAAGPNETDIDGQPRIDVDRVDIGADEYYTYTLTADIYHDGIVNFLDFAVLGLYWQQNEPLADITPPGGDGIVNFLDLGVLVDEWLLTEPWY